MQHRSWVSAVAALAASAAATFTGAPPASGAALPVGQHIVIATTTASILTGSQWQVTADVEDILGQPVSGATVWAGSLEPARDCGGDLTAAACTKLATDKLTADTNGAVDLQQTAALDTFVVLYLSDSQGALDPTTGQSVSVRTHNGYVWSGPSTATLDQYAIGTAPYMLAPDRPGNHQVIATGAGSAGEPRTEVSADGGTTWMVVGHGYNGGAFPITGNGAAPTNYVNFMASKPGTYQVRVSDTGGTYEDPGVSPAVTITVAARPAPEWLQRTNAYRAGLGLAPVADNPQYDAAVAQHVHWMNVHKQLAHSETPGGTGYTAAGNTAAGASDLAFGRPTATNAVDGWIGAPFHASCLLNSYWAVGGFAAQNGWAGEWCHSDLQTLDLATGTSGPLRTMLRRNYTFPSATMKVPLSVALNGNEAPDPVAGCRKKGVGPYWSVPVIFRVAKPPASDPGLRRATATLKTKSGRRIKQTCLITGTTYRGPDPASTQIGRLILGNGTTGRWAILLIKAGALQRAGTYIAALVDGRFTQRTTFTLATH